MKNTAPPLLKPPSSVSRFHLEDIKEKKAIAEQFHEALLTILQKWPNEFESDLLDGYQRLSVLSEKNFTAYRSMRHLLRIVCSHYLMRKNFVIHQQALSMEVDLEFRILPTKLEFPFAQKSVLGIAICIYLPDSYKLFEDRHILQAVQQVLTNVRSIRESFLVIRQQPRDPLRLIYLEIEKTDLPFFSFSEIRKLKQQLKDQLKKHVETVYPAIFGFSDTEETMRNLTALNKELHSESDIPQLMISFDKALDTSLAFRVLLVRPVKNSTPTISECFQKVKESFTYISERSSIIGHISSEHEIAKEASIFYLHIPKHSYLLRSNSSFNFLEARKHVLDIVSNALGEVRDYNGGIFAKQRELFHQFKQEFKELAEKDLESLEDFFYGLNPPEVQAILPISTLVDFFQLYLETKSQDLSKNENVILKTQKKESFYFAILRFRHSDLKQEIKNFLEQSQLLNDFIALLQFKDDNGYTFGYILPDSKTGEKFNLSLQKYLKAWIQKIQNIQVLRISMQDPPISLDPRFGGDMISWSILTMLFEGLMRDGQNDEPEFGIANSVSISKNNKKYTFKLRKCFWTNGDLVTSHDFCYSWKKILSPNFKSPFVYLFYMIKNAKLAKKGKVPSEQIGIYAIDDFTLEVELEHSYPFFLRSLSSPIFSPVNHRVDRSRPNWSLQKGSSYVCNGPFQLIDSQRPEIYELAKNPKYWDQEKIKLQNIQIITRMSSRKALEMYNNDEIDWLGRPFRNWVPFFSENPNNPTEEPRNTFTHWYVFNVKRFPFQSTKIRQALSLAIDRQAVISLFPHSAIPAFSPIPILHSQFYTQFSEILLEPDIPRAKELFKEGLKELGITHGSFPQITFSNNYNEIREKIAELILQQWKDVFHIDIVLENVFFKDLFKKQINNEFQIAGTNWTPAIDDPYYTFNIFKNSKDQLNHCKWENKKYTELIEKSFKANNEKKRNQFLLEAERLLIREVPIIPILHEFEPFRKKEHVKEPFHGKLYKFNPKQIFINNQKKSNPEFL